MLSTMIHQSWLHYIITNCLSIPSDHQTFPMPQLSINKYNAYKLLLANKIFDRNFRSLALPTMHQWIVLTRLGLCQCSFAGDLCGGTAELTHGGDAALANVHRREVEEFGHFTETLFGVRQECGAVTTHLNVCCNSLTISVLHRHVILSRIRELSRIRWPNVSFL